MSRAAANTAWARSFADELARAGVREVALAPGSRSTPLVLAFARDGRFRMRVHLDERSAAFFALGVGRASGVPAAVVTTSGTAAANLLPAVVEASQSEVPLLLLTADRPHRLRDADANQAIDQVRLYGTYTRAFYEVAPPRLEDADLRHLRTLACRSVADATAPAAGPVHLNFPFDKPLEPTDVPADFARAYPVAAEGRPGGEPFVDVLAPRAVPGADEVDVLARALQTPLGVIVAGPSAEPWRLGAAARRLAAATGFPLLADALSGARFGPAAGAYVVAGFDLFLREPEAAERLAPSVIVRVGASPTSQAVLDWLARHASAKQLVIDDGARWKDHGSTIALYVRADATATLEALAGRVSRTASDAWEEAWRSTEQAAREAVESCGGEAHEGDAWPAVLAATPSDGTVFVSSSMPVRELDAFGRPRDEPLFVTGNRGASGIDGIVSTAFGVSSQRPGPAVCVLGDIAFFHDQNGLLWQREPDSAVVFVLIDNDGGGIFHMLPVAEHEPHFTPLVATPHGLDLRHAAALHGIALTDVTIADLEGALRSALHAGRTAVLRVRTDRVKNHERRREVMDAVKRSVREKLTTLTIPRENPER
jgi:2-succinyl-5-enolpyruvyl-6-hydroxy-3-cyclohexene-1-carboxylate synthase